MGWIRARAYRMGVGSVYAPIQVEEPPGYTGRTLTPAGQDRPNDDKLRIMRNGRIVYASKPKRAY